MRNINLTSWNKSSDESPTLPNLLHPPAAAAAVSPPARLANQYAIKIPSPAERSSASRLHPSFHCNSGIQVKSVVVAEFQTVKL